MTPENGSSTACLEPAPSKVRSLESSARSLRRACGNLCPLVTWIALGLRSLFVLVAARLRLHVGTLMYFVCPIQDDPRITGTHNFHILFRLDDIR